MAHRWSTGPSKKPWICAVCRSTLMRRSAPAVLNRSAMRRAEIGSRPRCFLSWRAYAVERRDDGDALGRGPLERVDHEQLLHDPLVDRRRVATAARRRPRRAPTRRTARRSRRWRSRTRSSAAGRCPARFATSLASSGCARPESEDEALLAVRGDDSGHRAESFGSAGSVGRHGWAGWPAAVAARSRSARAWRREAVARPGRRRRPRRVPARRAGDPALDVALRARADAERARGHVPADHGCRHRCRRRRRS